MHRCRNPSLSESPQFPHLSRWGPSPRVTDERLPGLGERTVEAALAVAERLS